MKQKILIGLTLANGGLLLLLAVAFWVQLWPLELLVSFTPQWLILSVIHGLLFLTLFKRPRPRRWHPWHKWSTWGITSSLLAASFCLLYSLQVQKPAKLVPTQAETVRLATYNRLFSNPDDAKAATYFKDESVDVLIMEEAAPTKVETMRQLLKFDHAYVAKVMSGDVGEVGIVSRWPLLNVREIPLDDHKNIVRAELDSPLGHRLAIYGVHLTAPFTPGSGARNSQQFKELTNLLQSEPLPVVVGGDFNTTIFSPKMRHFVSHLDSKLTPTITTPWPACSWYGFGLPTCMRIDHIFLPPSAQLKAIDVSPALGSDHHAVVVEFNFDDDTAPNHN